MNITDSLLSLLQKWFATFTTLSGGLQLGALLLCLTLALLTHKHWQKFITRVYSVGIDLTTFAVFSGALNDPETDVGNVRSDVNLTIWKSFKQNNITTPFPQRDVRMIPADQ